VLPSKKVARAAQRAQRAQQPPSAANRNNPNNRSYSGPLATEDRVRPVDYANLNNPNHKSYRAVQQQQQLEQQQQLLGGGVHPQQVWVWGVGEGVACGFVCAFLFVWVGGVFFCLWCVCLFNVCVVVCVCV
jgi:hypothetical protein